MYSYFLCKQEYIKYKNTNINIEKQKQITYNKHK